MSTLKNYCENPILLIEGNPYKTDLDVKHNAIRGAILSIETSWYLPVVYSKIENHTLWVWSEIIGYATLSGHMLIQC